MTGLGRSERIATALVVLGSAVVIFFGVGGGRLLWDRGTITLDARAPEHGNWLPDTLVVPRGERVRLRIRNTDGVTHGFYLPALGITVNTIPSGSSAEIWVQADTVGVFPFYCSVWCSDHHMQMRGTVIVEQR